MTKQAYRRTPGSPPQVRGKLRTSHTRLRPTGITPAGAGKTRKHRACQRGFKDHPRRCGENRKRSIEIRRTQGSPPQVRGKLVNCGFVCLCIRITPAGAGKTRVRQAYAQRAQDHPRRCGENPPSSAHLRSGQGSPPQVRGKLDDPDALGAERRITPAGAGKTKDFFRGCSELWDHPRRCGENLTAFRPCPKNPGSPPQVRGKLTAGLGTSGADRITPAGAGKTFPHGKSYWNARDHPRRCGENAKKIL